MTTMRTCLTCGEVLPDTAAPGRRPNYCRTECRREHRNEIKRLEREIIALEARLDTNRRRLEYGWIPSYYGPATEMAEASLVERRADLEALREGVWHRA